MQAVSVFIVVLLVFAAYCIGSLIGYADAIKIEEKQKGCWQYSQQPYDKRF